MTGAAIVAFVILCTGTLVGLAHLSTRREDRWHDLARRLGLGAVKGWPGERRLAGRIDGFEVELAQRENNYIEMRAGGNLVPQNIELSRESSLVRLGPGNDVRVGDTAFDSRVRVHGDEATVLALMDERTRSLVQQLVHHEAAVVENGNVTLTVAGADAVEPAVREMLALCRALSTRGKSIPELLGRNAMEGPVGVRLRNLEVLKREFGASEVARTACRAAMGEHAAALRLAGAAGLGDEGAKVMKAIADKTSVDLVVRVRAVADLASRCSRDVAVARLGDLLGDETREVRIATITELGRLRSRTHAVELARLAPQAQGAEAAAIATALREVADSPSLEPALLSLLSKDDVATRVAAAHALRRVGTAAAVEPLLAYTEGLTVDADLKLAAREAIAGIQSRLGPVDAGRLALADATDSGSLSLAHGTGDLSLSREAGRLSQSTDAKQRASDLDATSSRGSDLG